MMDCCWLVMTFYLESNIVIVSLLMYVPIRSIVSCLCFAISHNSCDYAGLINGLFSLLDAYYCLDSLAAAV